MRFSIYDVRVCIGITFGEARTADQYEQTLLGMLVADTYEQAQKGDKGKGFLNTQRLQTDVIY